MRKTSHNEQANGFFNSVSKVIAFIAAIVAILTFAFTFAPGTISSIVGFDILGETSTVKVPEVTNLSVSEATKKIESVGLESHEAGRMPSDTIAEGAVISQFPQSGESLEKKGEVDYVVSSGHSSVSALDYVLPYSRIKAYTLEELKSLTNEELCIARNEIYARYGATFSATALNNYFKDKINWYKSNKNIVAGDMRSGDFKNAAEWSNIQTIKSLEEERGSKYVNTQTDWTYITKDAFANVRCFTS